MKTEAVNDKELYLRMFRATEAAIRLLITAQQECEEAYLAACEEAENGEESSGKTKIVPVTS